MRTRHVVDRCIAVLVETGVYYGTIIYFPSICPFRGMPDKCNCEPGFKSSCAGEPFPRRAGRPHPAGLRRKRSLRGHPDHPHPREVIPCPFSSPISLFQVPSSLEWPYPPLIFPLPAFPVLFYMYSYFYSSNACSFSSNKLVSFFLSVRLPSSSSSFALIALSTDRLYPARRFLVNSLSSSATP